MFNWLQALLGNKEKRIGKTVPVKELPEAVNDVLDTEVRATVFSPLDTAMPAPASREHVVSVVTPMQRSEANAAYAAWLFEWKERKDGDLFASTAENTILNTVQQVVKSDQPAANLVRRMPGVVPQLLQNLKTENFSGAQLARTISSDIVLVGEVVRLANSSYYNPAQPITSIESAILVLGHNGLRQLVTGVAFKPIIDMKSGRYTKRLAQHLWDHSETCAAACRQLAAGTGIDPFEAFLAGLIQNVGMIAALRIMDQIGDDGQEIGSPSFYSSLVRHTRSLTGSISREWRFPESVTKALEEQGQGGRLSDVSPLGKVLYVADYLVKLRTLIDEKSVKETPALTRGLNEREAAVLQDIRTARA